MHRPSVSSPTRSKPDTITRSRLYAVCAAPYTFNVLDNSRTPVGAAFLRFAAAAFCFCWLPTLFAVSNEQSQKPATKPKAEIAGQAPLPAQLTLLETKVRFESNGDSRKEVHAVVKINNESGAGQFARLNFNFNRAFESLDIPLVHITHAAGGSADVLPSAITDQPNPAVVNFPAYQDVRVKSVRILGLAPSDTLEYRVITTTTHHPLAPDFWFEHSFDRTGVVSHEIFELDLPGSRHPRVQINPTTPPGSFKEAQGDGSYTVYEWERVHRETKQSEAKDSSTDEPDVVISTEPWETLSIRLDERLSFPDQPLKNLGAYEKNSGASPGPRSASPDVAAKAIELTKGIEGNRGRLAALYDFVSRKITTVDLPLGSTQFATRPAAEVIASGYATQEDKFVLFADLASALKLNAKATLTGYCNEKAPARPLPFKRLLISTSDGEKSYWIDPSLEVAPFGVIPPNSGNCAFVLNRLFFAMNSTGHEWQKLEAPLPFPAKQRVTIDATLSSEGALTARTKYMVRGENELLLRLAFHQTPKEKWDGVAQLVALSDGFRGKVSNAAASDPHETHEPFAIEYQIVQPKFLDWSKKPLRIPAILPILGLPDPPAKTAGGSPPPIELGTPLDVEVSSTLHLPPGTTARLPVGTSVERDFATYASQYSAKDSTITAYRHLNFILREIPADRAADYNAFLRTVQNDESQAIGLDRSDPTTNAGKP
jgi:hypothetical protein